MKFIIFLSFFLCLTNILFRSSLRTTKHFTTSLKQFEVIEISVSQKCKCFNYKYKINPRQINSTLLIRPPKPTEDKRSLFFLYFLPFPLIRLSSLPPIILSRSVFHFFCSRLLNYDDVAELDHRKYLFSRLSLKHTE